MNKVKFSLRKANDVVMKLGFEVDRLECSLNDFGDGSFAISDFSFSNYQDFESVSKSLEQLVGSSGEEIDKYISLVSDLEKINETVLNANSVAGLNTVRTRLVAYSKHLAFAVDGLNELLLSGSDSEIISPEDFTEELFNSLVELNPNVNIRIRISELDDLQSKVEVLRKSINSLDEAESAILDNKEIVVTLSDYSVDFLGL